MGTNYYHHDETRPPCEHCGTKFETFRHIGKSSGGWCFSLHVYPDGDGPRNYDEWSALFERGRIEDEYGRYIPPESMRECITQRSWPAQRRMGAKWYASNHAQPGPNGLARHTIDGRHCIGHGEGTWDYIIGEFS